MSDEEIKNEEENNFENIESEIDTTEVEEFEFNEDGEEDLKKTIKKLRADLKQVKTEKEEYLNGWQKERADFANYKKAEDGRRNNVKDMIREDILGNFLGVADSFSMAFANREAWEKVDINWRKGVEYIYAQLNTIFEEYGVKAVGVEGETFDPYIHESIELVPTDKSDQDHKIAKVIQRGYKIGERVLRPARVKVFEYKNVKETL